MTLLQEQEEVRGSTMDRFAEEVQSLLNAGESQENVARFIAGRDDVTEDERDIARLLLRCYGLRAFGVVRYMEDVSRAYD